MLYFVVPDDSCDIISHLWSSERSESSPFLSSVLYVVFYREISRYYHNTAVISCVVTALYRSIAVILLCYIKCVCYVITSVSRYGCIISVLDISCMCMSYVITALYRVLTIILLLYRVCLCMYLSYVVTISKYSHNIAMLYRVCVCVLCCRYLISRQYDSITVLFVISQMCHILNPILSLC